MLVYLAGCMTYHIMNKQEEKATMWRKEFIKYAIDNNITYFNPMSAYNKVNKRWTNIDKCIELIVQQNIYFVHKSDICVVNLEDIEHSIGTIYEIIKFKEQNKPVIAFPKLNSYSPHLEHCITFKCANLEKVFHILEDMFINKD